MKLNAIQFNIVTLM